MASLVHASVSFSMIQFMFLYESICLCVLAGIGNDIDAVDLQVI